MQTSKLTPPSRMVSSLALALTTAAITACGGGSDPTTATAAAAGSTSAATSTSATTTSTASATTAAADSTTTATAATTVTSDSDTVVASASTDASAQRAITTTSSTATATRPASNTGTGFFTLGSKLYDANGKEFRVRGVNRVHWDSVSTGLWLSKANTERIAIDFAQTSSTNLGIMNNQILAHKIVPMPGNWSGTCNSDPAVLSAIVDTWVAQADTWKTLNANGLINIANEWGPTSTSQLASPPYTVSPNYVWRDSYVKAISRMRKAGYTGTLVIDAGGCGQDAQDVVQYGAAVLASDPQHNILFDVHVYGNFVYPATASWMQDYATQMAALKASGLPIMLGEFGPGRNIGPSPTLITPQQIVTTAETNGWGWLAWAWDDNNLGNCMADDNWFSMTTNCGVYRAAAASVSVDTDLTTFGKTVVPILQKLATPASIF